MRVIQKKISLEAVTSRLPGVVPAYRERDGKIYTFDDAALKKRDYAFPSNYGMIPRFVNIGQLGCLSWERISDWYHFFTDYYHLLNDWGHCGMKYGSAAEYYAHESKNGYADQMRYGADEFEYQELDRIFTDRGGKTTYDYICEYLIPSVDIPAEYKDYWHVSKLFYPDIVKWKAWFTPRATLYGEIELADCKKKEDCCDCTEYVNRGGKTMSDLLNAAYNNIQTRIGAIDSCDPYMMTDVSLQVSIDDLGEFSILSNEYELGVDYRVADGFGSTANTKGGTVVAVDGRAMKLSSGCGFTFNEEFMEKNYDTEGWEINNGGTVIRECEDCGHRWSDKELTKCPKCQSTNFHGTWKCEDCGHIWYSKTSTECPECHSTDIYEVTEEDEYTRYYQEEGRPAGYYGFNHDNVRVTGSSENDVRTAITESYTVESLNAMYIDDILYDIHSEEYGYYNGDTDKIYFVYREEYTQTPYTIMNGKNIYADVKPQSVNEYFYFPFFTTGGEVTRWKTSNGCKVFGFNKGKYKWFPRQRPDSGADLKEYIMYGGTFHLLDGLSGTRVKGRFYTPDGVFYVGTDNKIYAVNEYGWFEKTTEYTYDSRTNTAKKVLNTFVPVYNMSCVNGKAGSKLYELRVNNMLTDDTGEVIPGRYDISDKVNQQPAEGDVLDLIYEVGNTNRVVPFSGAGDNLYFGDIITSMKFYYKDYDGNKYGEVSIDIDEGSSIKTSLSAINKSTSAVNESTSEEEESIAEKVLLEPDIYCEIEYLIGTTLSGVTKEETKDGVTLVVGTKYTVAKAEEGYSNGVLYREEVQFVKTEWQYKLSAAVTGQIPATANKPTAHKLCYPVICYVLKQKMSEIDSVFGNKYRYALADFTMCFPPYSGWKGYNRSVEIFPVFRQEYLMGNATMQNLDIDIYIDRGINAAYEKHLKLGEVTTMEALEQYTNGYYKMIEN